jgi:EamA domain-containing membrane protein RarD
MDFRSEFASRTLRIVAIVALLLGLSDASQLLGVSSGAQSPIEILGPAGFAYLTAFSIAQLFASVGLWMRASWGAVLLGAATAVELLLFVTGSPDVKIGIIGFIVRLGLLISVAALLFLSFRNRTTHE